MMLHFFQTKVYVSLPTTSLSSMIPLDQVVHIALTEMHECFSGVHAQPPALYLLGGCPATRLILQVGSVAELGDKQGPCPPNANYKKLIYILKLGLEAIFREN
jgi:hypothetical protein